MCVRVCVRACVRVCEHVLDDLSTQSQLMHPHYHKRMSNLETLRQHPMYSTWDFVQVQNLEITPPFVPPVSEEGDCENVTVRM